MQKPESSDNYLKRCLAEFAGICKKKYGTEFNLAAVEAKVKHLRRKTPLTYRDLSYFESPEHWWFQRFWVFPPENRIEEELQKTRYDFWGLNAGNEAPLIRDLLYIFKSIELVSIVLRFIKPELYAIYSSPVVHLLELRRMRDLVETYIRYLTDLRDIRLHYGLKRVADADMAIWVLHEKCYGAHRDAEIEKALNEDTFMMRIRARNIVAPLAGLSDAQLANALAEIKPELASVVGCYTFEILLRALAEKFGLSELGHENKLHKVIDEMPCYGPVSLLRKAEWKRLKDIRDALFHSGRLPTDKERTDLVEEVLRLEKEVAES
jgi:hypothetical protein